MPLVAVNICILFHAQIKLIGYIGMLSKLRCFNCFVLKGTIRRQVDITTYQIRKIIADKLLCLFGDDMLSKLYPSSRMDVTSAIYVM